MADLISNSEILAEALAALDTKSAGSSGTGSNGITGSGTAGSLAQFDGTSSITAGPSFNSDNTATFLREDGTWAPVANVSIGQGYGTCSVAAATGAKTSAITGYKLATGGIAVIRFTYAVPVNATLNISGTGAKPMYFGNARIQANVIKAGDTVTFMFDGTYYHVISIDRWQTDIASLESRIAAIEEAVGCSL